MHVLALTVVHVPTDARIYHRQIRALLDARHTVTYAAPWSAYQAPTPGAEGLHALEVPRAAGWDRLTALRAARRLVTEQAGDHDLILLHDPELLVAVAGRTQRLPAVVWDVHEDLAASLTDRPWVPAVLRGPLRALVSRAESRAEHALHLLLAEEGYRSRFRQDHPVVPNYPWLGEPPDEHVEDRLVYVGRVSAARGARELVALGRCLDGEPELEVIGPVDQDVAGLIRAADRDGVLRYRGFLPNPAAMERIDGALAGLSLLHDHPNYRTSLPTKVLEYLSRAVPAITTPLPQARQVVTDHAAGLVVGFGEAGDVADDVVEAVRELRDDPEHRAAMGRRGRRAVADHYCWEIAGPAFVAQLEEWAG